MQKMESPDGSIHSVGKIMEKTLKGGIKVLMELLSLLSPEAFGRSSRIKRYAGEIAGRFDLSKVALDFDALESKGMLKGKALRKLKQRTGWYDPAVLDSCVYAFAAS